jgi:hypothetical protein
MFIKYAASAALSTVVLTLLGPVAAHAAAGPQTITRDGVSIKYQRVAAAATPKSGSGATRSDFDGDGLDDIAATVRGGVVVRYSSGRFTDYFGNTTGSTALTLGTAFTSGDFDNNGFDDLVVGDPDETDKANGTAAGGLWIVPGSAQGLQVSKIRHLNQSTAGVPDASESGDEFAGALAAGDINGDGRADLAVGLPGEDVGTQASAGGLIMLLSDANGVSTTGAKWLDQNTSLVPDTAQSWDRFGGVLAIGKFNADTYADLAIGSPGENEGATATPSKGSINLILGGASGLNVRGVASVYGDDFTQVAPGVKPIRLGFGGITLADTNNDGRDDLVAGTPEATVDGKANAGMVVTLFGGNNGFFAGESQVSTQNSTGIPGDAEAGDSFGASVTAGDITGDGFGDVVIGVPGEDVVDAPLAPPGNVVDAGVISLLRGSATGPAGGVALELSQGYEYTPGTSERGDRFGDSVRVLDLDGRDGLDAIVSAPGELGVDEGGPAPTDGDTPGAVTEYAGGEPNFMYGVRRTTGTELRLPGFNTNIYGTVL